MTQETTISRERIEAWRARADALDSRDMKGHIAGLPDQIEQAVERAAPFAAALPLGETPTAIAVCGMGGSAMGADLVAAVSEDRRRLPLVTVRGYDLPAWLDRGALAIVSSYSGNTEETLACYAEAKRRDLRVVAITTGGELGRLAKENGDPVLELPPGFPPRAAIGHSFAAVALVTARFDPGLEESAERDATAALGDALRPLAAAWLAWEEANPALEIAARVERLLPVLYAGHPIAVAASRRWKTQFNENGKIQAYWSEFPEHNHNEIVGFEGESPVLGRLAPIYLETAWDHPRVTLRMDFVHEYCRDKVGWQRRIKSKAAAETPREAMFRLLYLGDCASFFVSIVTGRDPTPVASIDRLKSVLSRNR
jgi:glucose/mannose-6-phosphate isomerase